MRRFVAAAVFLFVTACIPIHVPIRVVGIPAIYIVDQQESVRAGLKKARNTIARAPEQLPASHCGDSTCYSQHDLDRLLRDADKQMRQSFPVDAAPLLDAVEKRIAAEVARLGAPKPIDGPRLVSFPARSQLGFQVGVVLGAVERMVSVLDHLLKLDALALTLNVQTDPADAQFVIQIPDNNGTRRQVTTNSAMPNVWRGVYTATVNKRGFKDAVHTIDLFNDGRTNVTCTLKPLTEAEESVCHVE